MWLEIISRDGFHGVIDPSSNSWTALVHNATLHQGWAPVGLWRVNSDLSLLELSNGPDAATWILGTQFENFGDARHVIPSELFAPYRNYFSEWLGEIKNVVLGGIPVDADTEMSSFFRINQETRRLLAQHCSGTIERTRVRLAEGPTQELPFVHRLLETSLLDALKKGADRGALSVVDPVNGNELLLTKSIPIAGFRFLLPFQSANGCRYYLCVCDHIHCGKVVGLYDEQENELIVNDDSAKSISKHMFECLQLDLEVVAAELGDVLIPYLRSPKTKLAAYMRPTEANHMGHQLWNELSGLLLVVNNCRKDLLPVVVVPEASRGTEMFGPVEELFPEFSGKVTRLSGEADFRREALLHGMTLLRFSDAFVSRELRSRIAVRVMANLSATSQRTKFDLFKKNNMKIFLLGLRVENRTLIELQKFCLDFFELCERHYPGSVIVLDGHNSQATSATIIHSHGQWSARRAPIDVEREIAEIMENRAQRSSVNLVNNIGQPLSQSLFWSMNADAFVTIWGAGLAKYRWVANRPGIVITSKWNLKNRSDLHIYSSPEYVEDPEEIEFVDPEIIEDDMTAEPLMKFSTDQSQESYANFRIKGDLSFLKAYLDKFQAGSEFRGDE